MTIYGLYLQDGTPLALFDNVEVAPVIELGGNCERISELDIESLLSDYPNAVLFWSVYLHYDLEKPENNGFGGVECVADLPTKEAAMAYANGLEAAIIATRAAE